MRSDLDNNLLAGFLRFVIKRAKILWGRTTLLLNPRMRKLDPVLYRIFLRSAFSNIERLHRMMDESFTRFRRDGVFHFGDIAFVTQNNNYVIQTARASYELFFYPFFYGPDAFCPLLTKESYTGIVK